MNGLIAKNIASSITDLGALVILLIAARSHLIANEIFGSIMVAYFFGRGIIGSQKNTLQAINASPPNSSNESKDQNNNISTGLFLMLGAGAFEAIKKIKGIQ